MACVATRTFVKITLPSRLRSPLGFKPKTNKTRYMATIDDLMNEERDSNFAAELLRHKLNDLIARYQLSGAATLHMLARLSAGYIHQLQQAYNQQGADVVVEEDFQQMLTAYLTSLDMSDVQSEIEKIRKQNLN